MRVESLFNQTAVMPTETSMLMNALQSFGLMLMCCRIGIVQAFYPDDLTADVLIVNQKLEGLNTDGSQVTRDWAQIRAKVCYCSPYDTFPINKGDECLLLFSDREIESWFINGNTNPAKHSRMHDETDCIAVFGLRSLPNMIQILEDARHIFYGGSDIQIKTADIISNTQNLTINAETSAQLNTADYTLSASNSITADTQTAELTADSFNITSDVNITGNTVQTGSITADGLSDTTAASGIFLSQDNKTITVTNGIITGIT